MSVLTRCVLTLAVGVAVYAAPVAGAGPAPDGPRLISVAPGPGRVVELVVHSAAMAKAVTVAVLPAADRSAKAPVLYLLNGVDGGVGPAGDWRDGGNWITRADADSFFAGKQVTVVMPIGGAGSYYTDWRADDPVLGRQRWTTFLTRELPGVIDAEFHGTGANAVAGVSMAGTAAFQLALAAPRLYTAVGSYSGCVSTSGPQGHAIVNTVVSGQNGDPVNMWGQPGDPLWAANDPFLHAERLRGLAIYVSSGTGLPGALDTVDGPGLDGDSMKLVDQLIVGGALDAVTGLCTQQLAARLRDLAIPATVDLRPNGTHSWGYWRDDLRHSWPMFAAALRVG
ncbi:alpha/beta hydrolase [Nocardia fluminea]|uniref:S-formylglutathione hydrolase FrmB n=1 Tax=Nocardia fluminea TaxID=134984 RepID=A0A2N3VC33_9NOCA|nr:alpha/beta hydrolase family protein [Nocardia fluminea]PKV79204.1 S-formylglutathione hydrolase FrmB [Nocardia fluminea]